MILHGDCLEHLATLAAESVDSLVTDPPAGISFMGKAWDSDKGGRDAWVSWMTDVMRECHRVMKPGAHGLVWTIPRTSHWTMTALENAGFEIRDVVTHLFGTGFPKSLDVSKAIDKEAGAKREVVGQSPNWRPAKTHGGAGFDAAVGDGQAVMNLTAPATDSAKQWQGFGTALKPACEFWVLIRKPCSEKTVAKNVLRWGTGALNIDASRIGSEQVGWLGRKGSELFDSSKSENKRTGFANGGDQRPTTGRFPANLVLDEDAAAALDEQSGERIVAPIGKPSRGKSSNSEIYGAGKTNGSTSYPGEKGGASRFFYVAKASKSDRGDDNKHPTVKSTKLMSYLCRLVTPPGGTVLDPFMGSGSTGVAAKAEKFEFIGIEREAEYAAIAETRMA